MAYLLVLFIILKLVQLAFEQYLAKINRDYYRREDQKKLACEALKISDEEFEKTFNYTEDKYRFSAFSTVLSTLVTLAFIALGGLGLLESLAQSISSQWSGGAISTGLVFFGLLGVLSMIFSTPFDWYRTFKIEEKHGFNRQTPSGFISDRIKGVILGVILGGGLLFGILWIMEQMGTYWWIWAWAAVSGFSILTAWIYPTLLAPLFNKFKPLEEGELKEQIFSLARKIGFETSGISIMDASKRSSHGNAYFTGVFGKKKIVLFDTLVDSMLPKEIVAVLAHELGHFKLHHVRTALIRSIIMTGIMFYVLSLCLPLKDFYTAFSFSEISNFAALIVFTMWFGIVDFYLQPLSSWLSRKNEFAADAFAKQHMNGHEELTNALIKLRQSNSAMPITHPLYSRMYHSHPPLIERLAALKGT